MVPRMFEVNVAQPIAQTTFIGLCRRGRIGGPNVPARKQSVPRRSYIRRSES